MLELYRTLLCLRRTRPALRRLDTGRVETTVLTGTTWVRRWADADEALICLHTDEAAAELPMPRDGSWSVAVDTSGARTAGDPVSGSIHVATRCAIVLIPEDADA